MAIASPHPHPERPVQRVMTADLFRGGGIYSFVRPSTNLRAIQNSGKTPTEYTAHGDPGGHLRHARLHFTLSAYFPRSTRRFPG